MYVPLCREELQVQSYPTPPRSIPIRQTTQAGQEGFGCIRRFVGRTWKSHHTRDPNGASLSPKRPTQDRRDSGVSAAVCGGAGSSITPDPPQSIPIPQTAEAGPEGFGCIHRSLGGPGSPIVYGTQIGVPIPQAARLGPEGPGCLRRCVGRSWKFNHTRPPPRRVPIQWTAQV